MKILKLTPKGIAHYAVPLVVIVGVAIGGVAYLVASHAASTWNYIGAPSVGIMPGTGVAAASWAPSQRQDIFVTGKDYQVYHKWETYGQWSGWESLGNSWTTPNTPGAASQGPNQLIVVVRGGDNAVYYKRYGLNTWTNWKSLGGQTFVSPAVSSYDDGNSDTVVAFTGTDGYIYHGNLYNNGQSWTGGTGIGGLRTSYSPAAIGEEGVNGVGLDARIFAIGPDNQVWEYVVNGGGWYTHQTGCTNAGPAASGNTFVYKGCDNYLYYTNYLASTGHGIGIPGYVAGNPPAVIQGPGGQEPVTAYIVGGDEAVYYHQFND